MKGEIIMAYTKKTWVKGNTPLSAENFNHMEQGIAFILVSVVLLALTKPWAGKYINSRTVKTNVDSLVGERAVLTEDADSMKQTGKAVVNGQEWTVRPQDETQVIRKGELIEVVKISGVKLIVKRVKEA